MSTPDPSPRVVRFGAFELDVQSGELRKQGLKTRLTPQSFQVLLLLLERPGDVVSREALQQKLWPADTFVDFEMGLSSAVKKLRDALGDSAENPRFVETLPRRGYRFIADVGANAAGTRTSRRWTWTLPVAAAAVAGALIALDVGGARGRLARSVATAVPPVSIKSIAVLPLKNLSGDPAQDYFAEGMTEALITELAQVRGLQVISRTSMTQYQTTTKPVPEIARELGVEAVVEGSVVRVGQRVRITAQLIQASTDRHLWARSYERELRDVLTLQGEIASAIAQAVAVEVRPEGPSRLARTVNPEAYEAYLKGRFHWSRRSKDGVLKAADYFQQSIDADPAFAPAYSGLSDVYRVFDLQGLMPPRECMPKAEAAARKALAIDDTLAEAHASLASVLFRYRWDWSGAEKEYRRTLELDPNYAEGHRAYAIYLLAVHRNQDAVAEARRALKLSPLSPIINTELGVALVQAGRVDEGIEQLDKALKIDPSFARVYQSLAMAYGRKGDPVRAAAEAERGLALSPNARSSPWLGYWYGATGRRRQALDVLAEIEKRSRQQYVSPQSIAVVHLGLGEKAQALTWLEKAYEERAIEWLGFSTEISGLLQDEPRFRDLLRRVGLPTAAIASTTHVSEVQKPR